jgi:DNA (cytosine-5)-methyltransferase 1
MKCVDLFSGAGTVSRALSDMGMTKILSVDNWRVALESCALNTDDRVLLADLSQEPSKIVRKAGVPSGFDGLFWMSPPCQGFSMQRSEHAVDARNGLLPHCVSIIAQDFPKSWIIVENVLGFLLPDREAERIFLAKSILVSRGVALHDDILRTFVLGAASVGVPQSRKRLFIPIPPRGQKMPCGFGNPSPKANLTIRAALAKAPYDVADMMSPRLNKIEELVFEGMPPGGNWRSTPASRKYAKDKFGTRVPPESFLKRSAWGDLPACVMATVRVRLKTGSFMHPEKPRRYTLGELRAFQAIPDDFYFYGDIEERLGQIGNAVPPPMAKEAVETFLR